MSCQRIIRKWGNCIGLRLPQSMSRAVGISIGYPVEITIHPDGLLVSSPSFARPPLSRYLEKADDYELESISFSQFQTGCLFLMGEDMWLSLSPGQYNQKRERVWACSVTKTAPTSHFEIFLDSLYLGSAQADNLKIFPLGELRSVEILGQCDQTTLHNIKLCISAILSL